MEHYNRSESARFLGISRRTFYNWIGTSTQPTFTRHELEKLAARHAKKPTLLATVEALRAEVAALQAEIATLRTRIETPEHTDIDTLRQRIETLEQRFPSATPPPAKQP